MARTIEDEVEPYGPIIDAIAKDCAVNRQEIAKLDKRLDKTNVVLANLSFEVGAQRRHLAIISNDLTDMKDVVESTNLRVVKIEAEMTDRMVKIEGDVSDLNVHVGRMEATQQEHGDWLARILRAVEGPGEDGASSGA